MRQRFLLYALVTAGLSACSTTAPTSFLQGPAVISAPTLYSDALACLGRKVGSRPHLSVGIGTISDKTGKFSLEDGGYKVSQGLDLMVVSAFAKTKAVDLVERIDTRVVEWELKFANDKVLGDGPRVVNTAKGPEEVNYRGIYPGSLAGSDYYVVGGVTGLDYNIFSGGVQGSVSGIGGGRREYRLLVGIDMRLVDSRSSRIKGVATFQKEFIGVETEANVFRFFGSVLVDINAGTKVNEPMSLGVRAIIERATYDLISDLYDIPHDGECQEMVRKAESIAVSPLMTTAKADHPYSAP
jgi:curli biogenesis system outer membrane secretion channel CsgG